MPSAWALRSRADVAPGTAWLGAREQAVLAGLSAPLRRADWRLGRWTAKAVVGAGVEILAAADGAPEAWLGDERLPVSLTLGHRAGRAVAVVSAEGVVGCDLERLEPRSDAFVRTWLAPAEQAWVAGDRVLRANLAWTAKEAAAKVLREGLRIDPRDAVAEVAQAPVLDGWRPLRVTWRERAIGGWWRVQDGFVLTVAASPDAPPPTPAGDPAGAPGSPRRG